jgi:hypothetical protein
MQIEEWKPVPGYEGLYEVSDHGRVRSLPRNGTVKEVKVLKPGMTNTGRLQFHLSKCNKVRAHSAHTLVLEAFVSARPEGMECRHLDGCPTNNVLSNLKWGTKVENMADQVRHGTLAIGERSGHAKLTEEQVKEARSMIQAGMTHKSIAALFNVSRPAITQLWSGRNWKHIPIST